MAVPALAWYFLIRMGWGTGSRPTRVPCWRNFRISDSSVRPLGGGGEERDQEEGGAADNGTFDWSNFVSSWTFLLG